MPSQRRLRATVIGILAALVFIFYFTSSSSSSDRTFYDRTVEALKVKHDTEAQQKSGTAAVHDAKLREAANKVKVEVEEAADERRKKEKDGIVDEVTMKPGTGKGEVIDDIKDQIKDAGRKVMGGVEEDKAAGVNVKGGPKKPHEVSGSRGKWTSDDEVEDKDKKPERTDEEHEIDAELTSILKRSPIIIFSKTYCPFSKKAKAVFAKYSITPAPFIVEVDEHKLGPKLQDKLQDTTGRRTVPNVLINGKSIGGGDDVQALHDEGKLLDKIKSMGGKRIMEAKLKTD